MFAGHEQNRESKQNEQLPTAIHENTPFYQKFLDFTHPLIEVNKIFDRVCTPGRFYLLKEKEVSMYSRMEAYQLAINNEMKSQNLYSMLADSFREHDVSTFFRNLVPLEKIHEDKLRQAFAREFPGKEPVPILDTHYIIKNAHIVQDPKNVLEFAISNLIRIQQPRTRGKPICPKRIRKHLQQNHEPHNRRVRETRRRHRRRNRSPSRRFWTSCHLIGTAFHNPCR
jgi:hypothetical protein